MLAIALMGCGSGGVRSSDETNAFGAQVELSSPLGRALAVGDQVEVAVRLTGDRRALREAVRRGESLALELPWFRQTSATASFDHLGEPVIEFRGVMLATPSGWKSLGPSFVRGVPGGHTLNVAPLASYEPVESLVESRREEVSVALVDPSTPAGVFADQTRGVFVIRAEPMTSLETIDDVRLALVRTPRGVLLYGEVILPRRPEFGDRGPRRHELVWKPPTVPEQPVEGVVAVGYADDWPGVHSFEVYRAVFVPAKADQ